DAEALDQVEEGYGKAPPILAVEVLSPNDTHGKVTRRLQEQFRFGTRVVWVLDPDARDVSVNYAGGGGRAVAEGEAVAERARPDFRCRVADFFDLPGR